MLPLLPWWCPRWLVLALCQIKDGENGFLVNTPAEAVDRIVQLLTDQGLRQRLGSNAKSTVRANFLLTRLMEDWIDLLAPKERRSL